MRHAQHDFDPYTLTRPQGDAIALICDSPHSGTTYPEDFAYAIDAQTLRSGEDTHVQALWQAIPAVGGTLLAAEFPRSYIDPNRELDDLDAGLLDGAWPQTLHPTEKTRLGHGLIWRKAGGRPIYDRKLSVDEVQQRITRYHQPYHAALNRELEAAYERFGALWHLNLHSMPANSYEVLELHSDHPLADFVLGDRDGTTCAPEFVDVVAQALKGHGFSVAVNDPFKGVALIARIGQPAKRRHSLQIEVNRALYMDETTCARSDNFTALQTALTDVSRQIATYIREHV